MFHHANPLKALHIKMTMIANIISFPIVLAILLILAACGPSPEQQATMTATAQTATAAVWPFPNLENNNS